MEATLQGYSRIWQHESSADQAMPYSPIQSIGWHWTQIPAHQKAPSKFEDVSWPGLGEEHVQGSNIGNLHKTNAEARTNVEDLIT